MSEPSRFPTRSKVENLPAETYGIAMFGGTGDSGRLGIDPRTKLLFLVVCNVLLLGIGSGPVVLPIVATVAVLLALDFGARRAAAFIGVIAAFYVLLFLPQWWDSWAAAALAGFGFYGMRFYTSIMLALWVIGSTKISHFTETFYALRLPKTLIIPLTVMFRFFPVVVSEFGGVIEAMKLRGFTGWRLILRPIRFAEYIIVPTLSAIARIGDELAAAALIRGLGAPGRPTRMRTASVSLFDAALVLITVLFVIIRVASVRGSA